MKRTMSSSLVLLPAFLAAGGALMAAGCGRSSLIFDGCILAVSPSVLDFGTTRAGSATARTVSLQNNGAEVCLISALALAPGSDANFSLSMGSTLSVWPDDNTTVTVRFAPAAVSLPLARTGTLVFATNDVTQPNVAVPLTAKLQSECVLEVAPPSVDFGHVPVGTSASQSVTLRDTGVGPCQITGLGLGAGSDAEFALASSVSSSFTLPAGGSVVVPIAFNAVDLAAPHLRTGALVLKSTDPAHANVTVPLSAFIDIGCDLTITPTNLAFGNVILDSTVTASVTLGNDGSAACQVAGIALGAGTDPAFTLAAGQPTSLVVAPGGSAAIPISFGAFNIHPPLLKTGTLVFQTGNARAPNATVPLSAYVSTVCTIASQWIYTVDANGTFSRFDPSTLTFTDIGVLACPDGSGPNSMAVDQNAVAWVAYQDGNLFRVDTSSAACQATTFAADQDGLLVFGMGFVFDPSQGVDTLYIAGGASIAATSTTLATISFPSLVVNPVGPVALGDLELTGTGDGTLWGFVPDVYSTTGVSTLVQIDPTSGATLQSFAYPKLTTTMGPFGGGPNWAMKFWGGSFWIFLEKAIYQVERGNPQVATRVYDCAGADCRVIVGAGVSTCAPLQ